MLWWSDVMGEDICDGVEGWVGGYEVEIGR